MFNVLLFSLSVVNMDMRSGGSWVLANINLTGYYRVNYDLGNWERLLSQLNSEHQVLYTVTVALIPFSVFGNSLFLTINICCTGYTNDKQSPACGRCFQSSQVGNFSCLVMTYLL